MKRPFRIQKVGRFRRSAARGMAKAGIPAAIIATLLGIRRDKVDAIVEARHAPGALWSAAEQALFREAAQ